MVSGMCEALCSFKVCSCIPPAHAYDKRVPLYYNILVVLLFKNKLTLKTLKITTIQTLKSILVYDSDMYLI